MDRKALIKKLESELRQAHQDYLDGKCIPIEELDWGLPLHIAEPKFEYRAQNEAVHSASISNTYPQISIQKDMKSAFGETHNHFRLFGQLPLI